MNKTLILPILYTNNDYFNQSFIETVYAAILLMGRRFSFLLNVVLFFVLLL